MLSWPAVVSLLETCFAKTWAPPSAAQASTHSVEQQQAECCTMKGRMPARSAPCTATPDTVCLFLQKGMLPTIPYNANSRYLVCSNFANSLHTLLKVHGLGSLKVPRFLDMNIRTTPRPKWDYVEPKRGVAGTLNQQKTNVRVANRQKHTVCSV